MTQELRTRNLGLRRVKVSELEAAPWNFRTHPQAQAEALAGAVGELGFYGYPDAYETPEGTLRLVDGHLRKELLVGQYGPDTEIEVNVCDFDESEAKKATLTKDPLAAMAQADAPKLDALLRECSTGSEALAGMLTNLAKEAGIIPGEHCVAPDDFPAVDENIETEHTCPRCSYKWSGGA